MNKKTGVSPRKQPSQDRSKTTVDAVLAAAAHILESAGFDKTTTNRIAEKAGISIGSLYQYFPNKESLASALTERFVKNHASRVEKKIVELKDQPIDILLAEVISEVASMYLSNLKILRVLVKILPKIDVIPVVFETRKNLVRFIADELNLRKNELPYLKDAEIKSFVITNAVMGVMQMVMYDEISEVNEVQLKTELVSLTKKYILDGS